MNDAATMPRAFTPDEQAMLREVSRRPWQAQYHGTVPNETALGGAVEMFILNDDESGEQLVSIAVPLGCGYLAEWIAGCCARPWFVKPDDPGKRMVDIATAFDRALKPFFGSDGMIDGREVALAAITIMQAYIGDLPKASRAELIVQLVQGLSNLGQEA
jgi:hypothetical protein